MKFIITSLALLFSAHSYALTTPDWSRDAMIVDGMERSNIYEASESELENLKTKGYIHAMKYPVTVTGLLIPYRPLLNFMHTEPTNPLKKLVVSNSRKLQALELRLSFMSG